MLRRAGQERHLKVGLDLPCTGRDGIAQALASRGVEPVVGTRMHTRPDPDRGQLLEQRPVGRRRRKQLELVTQRIEEGERILT